jgi:hypothetical protein
MALRGSAFLFTILHKNGAVRFCFFIFYIKIALRMSGILFLFNLKMALPVPALLFSNLHKDGAACICFNFFYICILNKRWRCVCMLSFFTTLHKDGADGLLG